MIVPGTVTHKLRVHSSGNVYDVARWGKVLVVYHAPRNGHQSVSFIRYNSRRMTLKKVDHVHSYHDQM